MTDVVESSSDRHTDIFMAAESGTNVAKTSQPPVNSWSLNSPVNLMGVRPSYMDNGTAYNQVLDKVGARKYLRANGTYELNVDSKQMQYINDVINGTNTNGSGSDYGYDMGIYDPPSLERGSRSSSYDSDLDGMPDTWEIANGLNPDINDSGADLDGDGYTNIEEFLNLIDS